MKIVKKRVTLIFLTLLFTILAFGKVDLYAETTDEGTNLEESALSVQASETNEELEERPQEEIKEEVEENKEQTNTEEVPQREEKVEDKTENESGNETENKIENENETEDQVKEKSQDQPVSDAEDTVDQEGSKEEEIIKDQESGEKTEEETETEIKEKAEIEEKAEVDEKNESEETPEDSEEAKDSEVEEKTDEEVEGEKVLQAGEILEVSELAENPLALGQGQGGDVVQVSNFQELKDAITNAGSNPTVIKIMKSFEITETITIGADQNITLISDNKKEADGYWNSIEQPAGKDGEELQRQIIDEARRRGEEAIGASNDRIEGDYYNFEEEIVITRSKDFKYSMFDVLGKLTLGNAENSINFDGNKKNVISEQGSKGSFFDVQNGGELTLKNGVIANGSSELYYSAPIKLQKGSTFIINGGRITSNTIDSSSGVPFTAGGVYVSTGAKFIMNNGMIDHNEGAAGGIFAGDLFGAKGENLSENPGAAAVIEMNGGNIVKNVTRGGLKISGGIAIYAGGTLHLNDGIIAGNSNDGTGGGVWISDGYLHFDNTIGKESASTNKEYSEHLKENKAEANFRGGIIYNNHAGNNAGGIYIDSETVKFDKIMILDNSSTWWGGGVYYSFPPRVNKLEHLLITENNAITRKFDLSGLDEESRQKVEKHLKNIFDNFNGPGNGGGIWNCPTGYVHIGDGHSVYSYNNKADSQGNDLSFTKKTGYFKLNDEQIKDKFYSHVSPVTEKGNIIKFINDARNGQAIPEHMSYTNDWIHLRSVYSEELVKEAWKNSNVFIMGNTSSYGGGIGSNANMETPDDKGDIEFEFNKKWHPNLEDTVDLDNTEIHVDIFIVPEDVDEVYVRSLYGKDNRLFKYGEVTLNKANNWHTRFSDWKNNKYMDLPNLTKDNGLPFTKEELAYRGYKYLIMERETNHSVYIDEKVKTEKNGKMKIEGLEYEEDKKPDYFLYFIDKKGEAHYLTKADKDGVFTHPILDGKFVKEYYYGPDRPYIENGKVVEGKHGYKNTDKGYAFFIKDGEKGLELYLPYIYGDEKGKTRFEQTKEDSSNEKTVKVYEFDLTNSPYDEAKITKTWKNAGSQIPDQVTFYILENNKKIVESYYEYEKGKYRPVYRTVTVRKADNWIATIDKLNSTLLKNGAYSVEEIGVPGFTASYRILATDEKDKETSIQFRLKMLDDFEKDNKAEDGTKFFPSLGDISINLYLDGKHQYTKSINSIANDQEEVEYTLDDGKLIFGFDKEKLNVYAKGMDIKIRYYNAIENDILGKSYNLYLVRDEFGRYNLMVPNVLKDGEYYKAFQVTEKDPDDNGKYKVIEKFVVDKNSYKKPEYTFEVTNTGTPPTEPKTYVTVSKVWEALGETQAIRVQLYVNGEATNKFLTLSEENGWTATFYDLDIEDGFGNYYVYTVREVGDSNGIYKIGDREFEVSYAGNMDRGFTITNKEIPPEEPPEEPETPEPEEPEEPDEPEDEGGGRNIIPKTGVRTDIKSLYLSLIALIALVILRKKKYS